MTPTHLIELLGSFRARLRRLSALYGLGRVLLIVGGALLAIALFDWFFHLSKFWRSLFAATAVAVSVISIARHLVRPLGSRLPVSDIASRIERLFPQFEDRLRSAIGFIEQPESSDSPSMRQATIEQALNLASALPMQQVVNPKPALRSLSAGLMLVLMMGLGVLALEPATRATLLARLFNPLSSVQWPKRVAIAMVEPIARRVPFGSRVEVQVRLARGDSPKMRPIVYYETGDGGARQEFLTRTDDGRYTASLDARSDALSSGGTMTIRIAAGDDATEVARVEVVPRLTVKSFDAMLTAPAYAREVEPAHVNLLSQ